MPSYLKTGMAKDFSVNILGLSKSSHTFQFHLGESFFREYGQELIQSGTFEASVTLHKKETFIEADFSIKGTAQLECDRSLDLFDYPVTVDRKVVFKYGEEQTEVSDEIIIIPSDQPQLELGQLMYEFIALEIPMKKLHPRFKDDDTEGNWVFTSEQEEGTIDPRWEALKKLK